MPPEGLPLSPKENYLSKEAIIRFVRVASGLGVTRVRLSGGEPLLRHDLLEIVAGLAEIPGLKDIALTTNGFRLRTMAGPLKTAGLHRINVSLDSLDPDRFHAMTRSQGFDQVIAGIEEALKVGFPLKVNVVVLRGMNDSEILTFVELALRHSLSVRFLEFMPLCGSGWNAELVVPVAEIRRLIAKNFTLSEETRGNQAAQSFVVTDGARSGRVGFIGSLTEPFCDSCSRIRLSVEGKIRPCLFSNQEFSIRPLLDPKTSDQEIVAAIQTAVWKKERGSKYAQMDSDPGKVDYLQAYAGKEEQNPLIHNIGG
jgi:cyclic pyranopterin phosphate synthase